MFWDRKEESINFSTHFLGFLLSLPLGLGFLYKVFRLPLTEGQFYTMTVYPVMVSLIFLSSMVYHYTHIDDVHLKHIARKIDIILTLFFIPVSQTVLVEYFLPEQMHHYKTFLLMNWLIIGATVLSAMIGHHERFMTHAISTTGGLLSGVSTYKIVFDLAESGDVTLVTLGVYFAVGGFAAVVGAFFFLFDTSPRFKYFHAYWHLFAMSAVLIQYVGIILALK